MIPGVTQGVDVEGMLPSVLHHDNLTVVGCGVSNLGEANAVVLKVFLHLTLVGVRDLNDDTRILCEEHLHHVVALRLNVMQIDMQTAFGVGEGHLEQGCDETTGRDVVAGHHPAFLDKGLDGIEAVGEVLCVLHRRHIRADAAQCLRKGRTAKALLVEAEVYII